jgi:hypothetical protein
MELVGAGAIGLIFVGVVFLILVPVTARMRTHGKSKEEQRSEYFERYDKRMDEFRRQEKAKRKRR